MMSNDGSSAENPLLKNHLDFSVVSEICKLQQIRV